MCCVVWGEGVCCVGVRVRVVWGEGVWGDGAPLLPVVQ